MALKRREPAAVQHDGISGLRHPLLRLGSLAYTAWFYVKDHPGCTREEVQQGLQLRVGTANTQIHDLLSEGLLYQCGTKLTSGMRKAKRLYICEESTTSSKRDALTIDIVVKVNAHGEYSIETKLHGQRFTADRDLPHVIHRKRINLTVPRPQEGYRTRPIPITLATVDGVAQYNASTEKCLTIEGSCVTMSDD